MLSEMERLFLKNRRVAHLATADRDAAPHVWYRCVLRSATTRFTSTIDAKPKRSLSTPLKRLKNIANRIQRLPVVVDRYEEDWGQLGEVMP